MACRRPQVQERLTGQVADAIFAALTPRGVAVELEAEHLCMAMRGVQKPGSKVVTTAVRGDFANTLWDRDGLLALLRRLPDLTTSMAITPLNSFQEIRVEWLDLLAQCPVDTFCLLPQWQEVWWDAFREGRELAGFYLQGSEGVTAIASLARQGDTLSFVGNTETFDYNDFMIRPGAEADFFAALLDWLQRAEWQTLELPSLVEGSPTLEYLPDLARRQGYSVEVTEEDVTPAWRCRQPGTTTCPSCPRRTATNCAVSCAGWSRWAGWRWYCVQEPAAAVARLDDFLALMRQSDPERTPI